MITDGVFSALHTSDVLLSDQLCEVAPEPIFEGQVMSNYIWDKSNFSFCRKAKNVSMGDARCPLPCL